MAGGMVPRADSILLVRAEYFKVLYSYGRRNDISAYSNSDRASRIRLVAKRYEEMDCPKCYTYKEQELESYIYIPYLSRTTPIFYSSFTIERRIPRKTTKLSIGNKLTFAAHFAIDPLHLEFQHQDGSYIERTYKTKYMSTTVFYVLV